MGLNKRGHGEYLDRRKTCCMPCVPNAEVGSLMRRRMHDFRYEGNGVIDISLATQVRHSTQYKEHVDSILRDL